MCMNNVKMCCMRGLFPTFIDSYSFDRNIVLFDRPAGEGSGKFPSAQLNESCMKEETNFSQHNMDMHDEITYASPDICL